MDIQDKNRKRRCNECKQWTVGNVHYCGHCHAVMNPELLQARLQRIEKLKKKRQEVAEELQLPPGRQMLRRIGRMLETAYLAVVSFIAWLLFWIAG